MNRAIVTDLYQRPTIRAKRMQKILLFCMKKMQLQDHEVHLSLIDDAKMQELNRTYRNKNKTTDVLSFEQGEHIGKHFFLGDILISLAQTKRQASVQRHRIKDELAILSIHGLLHLLGYDHMEIEDEKIMFAIQNDLFQQTLHF